MTTPKPAESFSPSPLTDAPLSFSTELSIPPVPFWKRPEIQNLASLLISLLVHISIISVALITYKTYTALRPVEAEQLIIPDAAIIEGAAPGGIPNPGLGADPTRSPAQENLDAVSDAQSFSSAHSKPLSSSLMSDPGAPDANSLIGLGSNGATGTNPGPGAGDTGGPIAPFGVPGGGQSLGPRSAFMGLSGNALRIAYVCDVSGSMVDKIDVLKAELSRSIQNLKPIQSFNVIFFNSDRLPCDPRSLLIATADNKHKALTFVSKIAPSNTTDPIPALELAFKQEPQLIYLLTDGDFDSPDDTQVRAAIKKLNPQRKVKINTIAFVASREELQGQRAGEFVDFLKLLAKENGGVSRVVASTDLSPNH